MSDYRLFQVRHPHTLLFKGGDVIRLMPGETYVDTIYYIDNYAHRGVPILIGDDLCRHRIVREQVPNPQHDYGFISIGGVGDILAQEPGYRWLGYPPLWTPHHRMGIIKNQRSLPARLDDLPGTIVIVRGIDPNTPDQWRPMQDIFISDFGVDGCFPESERRSSVIVEPAWHNYWQQRLEDAGVVRPWVVCQVAPAIAPRSYPLLWLLSAMDMLSKHGCGIVLTGEREQYPVALRPAFGGSDFYDALGQTDCLPSYVGLISCADVLVTPATGACHIGEALDKPTVLINALYPTVYEAGYHRHLYPVESGVDCSPCISHPAEPCNKRDSQGVNICWLSITPQMIVDKVNQALADIKKGSDDESPI